MKTKIDLATNLVEKVSLSDDELENISGGGVLSYAIEMACAALGGYFANIVYDTHISDVLDKQVISKINREYVNIRRALNYADTASRWVAISQGAVWAAALAETICKKLHIK